MFLFLFFTSCIAKYIFTKEHRQVLGQIIIQTQSTFQEQILLDEKLVISLTNYNQQRAPLLIICNANITFSQIPDLITIQRQNCIADLNSYDLKRVKQQIIVEYKEEQKSFMNIIMQEKDKIPFIMVYSEEKMDFDINIRTEKKSSCLWECKQSSSCIKGQCACQEGFFGDDCSINILQFLSNDNYEQDIIYYINVVKSEVIQMNFTDKSNFLLYCLAFNPYIYRGKFFVKNYMELTHQQQIDCINETQKINKQFTVQLQPLYLFIAQNYTIYKYTDDEILDQYSIIYIIVSIGIFLLFSVVYCCFKFRKQPKRMDNLNDVQIQNFQKWTSEKLIKKFLPIQLYDELIKQFPGLLDDDICQICLDQYKKEDQVRVTQCTHFFHVECIDLWIEKNEICPTCRSCLNIETTNKITQTCQDNCNQQLITCSKQIIYEQSQNNIRLYGFKQSCHPTIPKQTL
ncbi:unnamed protein product [Paramecium sonneborni]|uniref:RING-type domain-containing protein n=1 Tax=Paramecium sonneborni TaxID=65129 RepID=A0A8S1KX82_9CILI|nr:unnamed protein product [Paramecium sonneborni]